VLTVGHLLLSDLPPSESSPLLLLDRAFDVGVAIAIVSLGAVIGLRVARFLAPSFQAPLEQLLFATGIGLGIIAYATLGLGLLGLFYGWALVLLLGLLALAMRHEWTHLVRLVREAWASREPLGPFERCITALVLALLLLSLLRDLTPPTDYDGLVYHLTIRQTFLREHHLVPFLDIPHANFPATTEMLYIVAMGLGSPMCAKLLHLSFGLLTTLALFCLARHFLSRGAAWLSMAVLWSLPIFVMEAGWAYVDLAWTFYETLAIFAFLLWTQHLNRRWLILSGLFMGLALGTKYMAGYGWILLAGAIAFQSWISNRKRPRELLKALCLFAMVSGLVASPWYLKNWLCLGNPIYPVFFGGLNYGPHRMEASAYLAGNIGMGRCFRCYLLLIWNIYAHSNWFGGSPLAFPSFLSLSLPLWVIWRRNRGVNWVLALSLLRFMLWAATLQNLRYLLPIYPALSIATGYILHQAILHGRRRLPWDFFVRALVVSLLLINVGLQLYKEATTSGNPLPVILGSESQVAYLRRTLVDYPVTEFINTALPSEAKVLFIGDGRSYYFEREHIPDATHDNWWGQLVPLGGSQEGILALLRRWGVSHILFSEGDVEYRLVFDAEGRIEQGMQLFFAFKERYLSEIYGDQWGFHLYEVRPR